MFEETKNWMTCDFDRINFQSLFNRFVKKEFQSLAEFHNCVYRSPLTDHSKVNTQSLVNIKWSKIIKNIPIFNASIPKIQHCVSAASAKCRDAPVRMLKFIKLRMREVHQLIPFFPNMKVIYLNRDPRGILNSKDKLGINGTSNIERHCKTWSDDLKYTRLILKQHPDTFFILNYEDLAETPIITTKKIFQFIGLRYTTSIEGFIRNVTRAKNNGAFGVQRQSSEKTASLWRNEMSLNHVKLIDQHCKDSMKLFGYLPFADEVSLRNLTLPSRVELRKNSMFQKQMPFD